MDEHLETSKTDTKKQTQHRFQHRRGWRTQRRNPQGQDVRAIIWNAVLAVRWPVVRVGYGWPGPEVLLSLLPEIRSGLYPAIPEIQCRRGFPEVIARRPRPFPGPGGGPAARGNGPGRPGPAWRPRW